MTVTSVHKDPDALTLTVTAEFDAPVARVWRLWDDPRLLERWWGPPSYPATVVDHDLTPGGTVSYYMTGPTGDRPRGFWRVLEVDPPRLLEVEDGFADDTGTPDPTMPTSRMRVTLGERADGGTTVDIRSTFPSLEHMERLVDMGMEEGLRAAMGQMDALVAA
jgi:uncharacterized protein YndB with AHSA1/START domain